MNKDQIYTLQLIDGLKSNIGGKEVRYKTVHLRETNVGDECAAVQMAERVVNVGGKPTLLVSDEIYRIALTMRHIDKFSTSGLDDIGLDLLTLDMIGRLSNLDMQRIEERCLLVSLAAQVRYGLLDSAEFDSVLAGEQPQGANAPRSEGQAATVGNASAEPQPGPSMLADYSAPRA